MPDSESRLRSYLGLAFVIIAYVGGIIGWSWAAITVDSDRAAPDTTQAVVNSGDEMPPDLDGQSASLGGDR